MVVAVALKVVFNRLVLTLSLAVHLGMEGGAKAALYLQVIIEGALELASENGNLVRNDALRDSIKVDNCVKEQLR